MTLPQAAANNMDALAQLRDIHLPAPVSLWPPAPGWWLVGLTTLAVLSWLGFKIIKHWHHNAYRRLALKELQQLQQDYAHNLPVLVEQLSLLLKRVALVAYPRAKVAGLTGQGWLQFLDQTNKTRHFSTGPGQVLVTAPYDAGVAINLELLTALIKNWIKTHR